MVDIDRIKSAFVAIAAKTDLIVVEGAGGWWRPSAIRLEPASGVPRWPDMAVALELPVLLVVGLRLGA